MPMAPAQPLFLMHCGVNRFTQSGRVAAPEQCVSREGALKAVTLDAAYSLQLEKEMGSIVPGKLANFTILADNPVTCEAAKIKDIAVIGTIHEGRVFPVKPVGPKTAGISLPETFRSVAVSPGDREIDPARVARPSNEAICTDGECSCSTGRHFAELLYPSAR